MQCSVISVRGAIHRSRFYLIFNTVAARSMATKQSPSCGLGIASPLEFTLPVLAGSGSEVEGGLAMTNSGNGRYEAHAQDEPNHIS
jgi:hypothetical protein